MLTTEPKNKLDKKEWFWAKHFPARFVLQLFPLNETIWSNESLNYHKILLLRT